jgi:hypothetical protein
MMYLHDERVNGIELWYFQQGAPQKAAACVPAQRMRASKGNKHQ